MPDLDVRRLGRTEMRPKALGLGGGYLAIRNERMRKLWPRLGGQLIWGLILLIRRPIMVSVSLV